MKRLSSGIPVVLLLALLVGLFGVASGQIESFDIFWQLQSGKYILETGSFIYQDTFTLAAEAPRFEHCWLHDLVFYCAYMLFGYAGISLLKGFLVAMTALFLGCTARARGSSWLAFAFCFPVFYAHTHFVWRARPQLWSFMFMAICLWLFERYSDDKRKLAFVIVPVSIVWANLHAGVILVFPLMLAYLVGEVFTTYRSRIFSLRKLLYFPSILLFLVSLGILLTPYGTEILETLILTPTISQKGIYAVNLDWRAMSYDRFPQFYWGLSLCLLILGCTYKKLIARDLLMLVGLAIMGLKLERHSPLFLFAAIGLVPKYLDVILVRFKGACSERLWVPVRALLVACSCVGLVYFGSALWKNYGFFDTGLKPKLYPVEASSFIAQNRLSGNLYNSYSMGGYLMWKLFPEHKVFWDGRHSSPVLHADGLLIGDGRPGWEEALAKYKVNTIITEPLRFTDGSRYRLLDVLRRSSEWVPVFADETFLVFVREGTVSKAWLKLYQLPWTAVEETLLSTARYLIQSNSPKPRAFWEAARILIERKDYQKGYLVLRNYLERTPEAEQIPEAKKVFLSLNKLMGNQ